jgi:CheY-like chemotaxis protein
MAHVLVVEDDGATCRLLQRILTRSGLDVACAYNGQEALAAVATRVPDVVVTDLTMPVMDGIDFLHALRGVPRWRSIPVVVVTAVHDSAVLRRAESYGLFGTFMKGSLDVQRLLDAITGAAASAS